MRLASAPAGRGQTFGLIAPGVEMADVLAFNFTQAKLHQPRVYKQPDVSTKLKLLGVDVASFGDYFADRDGPKNLPARAKRAQKNGEEKSNSVKTLTSGLPPAPVKALTYKDPFQNIYKKYIFTMDGDVSPRRHDDWRHQGLRQAGALGQEPETARSASCGADSRRQEGRRG